MDTTINAGLAVDVYEAERPRQENEWFALDGQKIKVVTRF